MEIPRHWRLREFRYRMAVKSHKFLENNPYVGLSHVVSSGEVIEKTHENLLKGEIDVLKAVEESGE